MTDKIMLVVNKETKEPELLYLLKSQYEEPVEQSLLGGTAANIRIYYQGHLIQLNKEGFFIGLDKCLLRSNIPIDKPYIETKSNYLLLVEDVSCYLKPVTDRLTQSVRSWKFIKDGITYEYILNDANDEVGRIALA